MSKIVSERERERERNGGVESGTLWVLCF